MNRKDFITTIGLSSIWLSQIARANNFEENRVMTKFSKSFFRIAVLADIHGNSFALKSILEDIDKRNIKDIINLGDIFYGPLNPHETFELLSKYSMHHISGNMDRYMLEVTTDTVPNPTIPLSSQTMKYVIDSFATEELEWIHKLPKNVQIDNLIYACHGNILTDDLPLVEEITKEGVLLKNDETLTQVLQKISQPVILCAHTHIGRLTQLTNGKIIINPGSVGLPAYTDDLPFPHKMESNSPFAKYCILEIQDDQLISCEQINIKYDWNAAVKLAAKNKRPDWEYWLKYGKVE